MTPIRNEKHEIIGYRHEQADGQARIRDKYGELVGWIAFGEARAKGGFLVSFQECRDRGREWASLIWWDRSVAGS